MNWEELLGREQLQNLDALPSTVFHLILAVILGQVLVVHYLRYAAVLSNKRKFARIFVGITATTFLVVSAVKSSVVLSLGLMGALSIIRFRTPIKEPEELAYLFMAIAIGVGLAAQQAVATVIVLGVVLVYQALRSDGGDRLPLRTILQVTAPLAAPDKDASGARELRALLPAVESRCAKVDLRRVDCHDGQLHASLIIEVADTDQVAQVLEGVQSAVPGASASVIERDGFE